MALDTASELKVEILRIEVSAISNDEIIMSFRGGETKTGRARRMTHFAVLLRVNTKAYS